MNPRGLRPAFLIVAICLLPACSSTNAPGSAVTLLVTNATCTTEECTPLKIHGFVPKFAVPGQPKWGFLDVGAANSALTCLTLPHSDTLTLTGPDDYITWTVVDPIILTAVDLDYTLRGRTTEFVPADAPGWAVSFGGPSPAQPLALLNACMP
ncbi:MAG: hypothetical protein GTO22_00095 [Gemmatimonadales bacterium]|nr:hypothetical protein [Gemmatimonadales bacterium]